jgi:cytoskeletal protein RodZ
MDDFSDILRRSKFDKFKPFLMALTVIVVIVGLGVGALVYYGHKSNSERSYTNDNYSSGLPQSESTNSNASNATNQSSNRPTTNTSDSYKATTYPSSSSYDYKPSTSPSASSSSSSYTPTGSSSSSSTPYKDAKSGCVYTTSDQYSKCLDEYYAPKTSTPPSDASGSSSQSDQYAALNECLNKASKLPTEASRVRAKQGCYTDYTPKP